MAELFLADRSAGRGLSRRVVLKRVLPGLAKDAQFRDAFVHEARIALSLDHGHIVRVYDFFEAEGTYLLEMEFVDGADVRRLVRDQGPLPTEMALFVTCCVLRALDYAHRLRGKDGAPLELVHRDVSPANVLVSREGEVKLADFGLARSREKLVQSHGGVKGTFAFMSPEQAEGLPLDARSDLFAAAAVLYAMISGNSPFAGEGPAQTLDRVRSVTYIDLSDRMGLNLYALDRVLARALSRAPEARYPDANALRDALENVARESGLALAPDALASRVRALDPHPPDPIVAAVQAPVASLAFEASASEQSASSEVEPQRVGVTRAIAPRKRSRRVLGSVLLAMGMLAAGFGGWSLSRPRAQSAKPGAPVVAVPAPVTPMPSNTAAPVVTAPPPVAKPIAESTPARPRATLLTVSSDPWAYVDIDGKRRGTTPLVGIAILPGVHDLVLQNPALGVSKRQRVRIRAGEHRRIIERLSREN